jgi:hypothetical protein
MVQQLERLQQEAGGRQPHTSCPLNELQTHFMLTHNKLLQEAQVYSVQHCATT